MPDNAINIHKSAMNIFYHNFTAVPCNDGLPEVLRARYISLPEIKEKIIHEVTLTCYLGILSFSAEYELWRFAGEKKWQKRLAGKLYLFAPGTVLEIQSLPNIWRHGMMIYFHGGKAAGIDTLFNGEKLITFDDTDGKLSKIIMETAMMPPENSFYEARLKLLQLLTMMHTQKKSVTAEKNSFADNVDNLLRRSLGGALSREDIAKELNISVSLLSHRYLQERGIPVMQRHLQLRLEQAKLMLLNGATIQLTAETFGFCSSFHLSRAFKQYYGASPSHYIKQLLKDTVRH